MSEDADQEAQERDSVGRPSKYKEEYCDRVIELGKLGASKVEIAFELNVGMTTIQRWEVAHPEFRVALTRAIEASQVWWERIGRQNLTAQSFQSSMWSRSMAARFPNDWRESKDLALSGSLQVTEIKRTIVDPRNSDA